MSLSQGQIAGNRYRIARLLGQGGMGAVYRAWDLSLSIPVALKEMVPEPGLDPRKLAQLRAQFQREARVLAGLSHPNLPRVTDFFEWGGNAYLVMDFVEGESLDQLIARQRALPESSVMSWAGQLLDALATCHACRIVHRDVKPQNIIVRPDGKAVLVDFGLVKLWDPHHPQTQNIIRGMGTAEYASPEHLGFGGHHTQPRSDIYSLGATLYHALTGQEPPSAPDRWAGVALVPPRDLCRSVRPQTEAIILKAMALEPFQRFSGALEMQAGLQSVAGVDHPSRLHVAGPLQSVCAPNQHSARPVSFPRDTRWPVEMAVGMVMALVGVLVNQVALLADVMTLDLYLGRSIFALLLGALGWFLGDLVFQALARPEQAGAGAGAGRPTQRLVSLTRRMARRLSLAHQIGLLVLLLASAAVLVWLLAPAVVQLPFIASYVSLYAAVGPLAYAAAGRRPGRALVAHVLVTTIAGAVLAVRVGLPHHLSSLFLACLAGGSLMEGVAFLAERQLFRR